LKRKQDEDVKGIAIMQKELSKTRETESKGSDDKPT